VVTFVVDEDDVQLVATNAPAAIDNHRASLLRQGIDIPRTGAIAYQLAWTRRNEFLWISSEKEKWIDYGKVIRRHDPNVSHPSMRPACIPRRNHSTRCADEPCVKFSGAMRPVDMRWIRSSPIAAAAFKPSSTSPRSRI
jgi:hypothetical protein